ncbi:MAG: hypothetical protein GTO24_22260 [candidate division Zixibacteria bacterium]|nr:hypothetical protein [candidate division Zixibacteria bacterium]
MPNVRTNRIQKKDVTNVVRKKIRNILGMNRATGNHDVKKSQTSFTASLESVFPIKSPMETATITHAVQPAAKIVVVKIRSKITKKTIPNGPRPLDHLSTSRVSNNEKKSGMRFDTIGIKKTRKTQATSTAPVASFSEINSTARRQKEFSNPTIKVKTTIPVMLDTIDVHTRRHANVRLPYM